MRHLALAFTSERKLAESGFAMNTNPKAKEILTELKREMAMRRRVYPRWVTEGRMTQEQMAQRMRCVQAAIDLYETMAKAEEPQKDLF